MTTARPAAHAATNSSRVRKHEPVVGWAPNHNSCSSENVKPQLSMSLTLPPLRGTGILPYQALKQEMARLLLAGTHTNQVRATYPAKLKADGVGTDASSLDRISEKA